MSTTHLEAGDQPVPGVVSDAGLPSAVVEISPTGGRLRIGADARQWESTTDDLAREHARSLLVAAAAEHGALRVRVHEPEGTSELLLAADGVIVPLTQPVVRSARRAPLRVAASTVEARGQIEAPTAVDDGARLGLTSTMLRDALSSVFEARACRSCGCTDDLACEGGCWWVEADLCSSCLSDRPAASTDHDPMPAPRPTAAPMPPAPARDTAESPPLVAEQATGPGRRRRTVAVVAAAATATTAAAGGVLWWARPPAPAPATATVSQSVQDQWAADDYEQAWLSENRAALVREKSDALRADRVANAHEVIAEARAVLDASPQAGDAPRAALTTLLDELQTHVDDDDAFAAWSPLLEQVPPARQAVIDAQSQWQTAEAERVAAEQAAAAAAEQAPPIPSTGSGSSSTRQNQPSTGGGGQPSGGGGSTYFEVSANPLATNLDNPGVAKVSVSITGSKTVTVVFNIGGRSVTLGTVDGSGSLVGEVTGLPPGDYSWTVTAGGLTATGRSIHVF